MRALNANEAMYFNEMEYQNFVKNVECRKLSKERQQELKVVSNRFSQAKRLHGKTKLTKISGTK
ncbi:hypothetical protein NUITMVRE34_11000 [Enterococcus gallinarum]|uniref:hypothetical protein n=1 Tax=Enterococcus TaxID=1350 RepID=UPI00129C461A|nr:hypothetical protein [Enterococcus casseliflavus]MRI70235.1 hypothetical protein [Enterococcus casseliflavus]GMS47820.1 hypothetical protein NUITMVRE34_11000 [Enterococcus gallinarum]GMS50966.1 hypothetical protein NUITMVRE35_11010 [Enterococcus gallinarum]